MMLVRVGSGGSNNDSVLVDGRNPMPNPRLAPLPVNLVGSAFLHTLGIPLALSAMVLLALAGIATMTLAAAITPARRAASVDPMRALRRD